MGVQDFNPQVQKAVNRIQPETMTTEVVGWIRQLGFESLNLDLIYGLPFQTAQSFSQTVDRIIAIAPDRIAVFNYAHVPWMKKHMGLIHAEDIPAPEEKLEILKMTAEKLVNAGYVFIGMDHFAKPDDELAVALNEKKLYRNFQGYSTHAGADLYALGITSISQLKNVYAQNFKTEKEYYQLLEKNNLPVAKGYRLSDDDQIRRYVIMKLMCDFELDISDVEHRFNIDFAAYFSKGIQGLEIFKEDDLVTIDGSKIVVKGMGQFLIRNIAINFDGYIERNQDTAKYSKTV
jgi:oxygen-independent coproporphyrinogen-3 oxidase